MPADLETLLAEAPWLARLARSLTGDAAEAEDIVQETYAAALRSPPEIDRPIRPWLRRVVVNLARMRHRGRTRRAANEQVVEDQLDPVRTPDELLARAQLERRLAELVIALDEPFRTTVLLRYREGLSAEQIAKQQGIPAGTVRSRLKNGLDRLRDEIDPDDRKHLRAFFAPLVAATRPAPLLSATPWRLIMAKATSKIGLAFVALVLLLLGGGALLIKHRSAATRIDEQHPPPHSTPSRATHAQLGTLFVQPGVPAQRIRGSVTSDGGPYRAATVRLFHAETAVLLDETMSAADGSFDLGERAADVYVVTADAPERSAMPVRVDLRAAQRTLELRLSGCSHVRGTVVDGSGAPIGHARVAREGAPWPGVETDTNGRYDLCTHFGSTTIRYSASGYQSVLVGLALGASTTRDVVLIPEAVAEGMVLSEDGAPVAGAWVLVDPSDVNPTRNAPVSGFSDTDGTFRITGVSPGRNLIAAFAPGQRSSHKQQIVVGAGQVTSGIIVRLTSTATIEGIVVSGGAPVAGAGVGIRIGNRDDSGLLAVTQPDGTFTIRRAPHGDVALYVDNHTVITPRSVRVEGTTRVKIEVERMGSVRGRVLRGATPVADAQVSCKPGTKVFTDAAGAYLCDGLDEGPQDLSADVPSGEWGSATATVTRGQTAHLDIPLTFAAAICGRVVDEHATPLRNIEVRVAETTSGDFGMDLTAADGSFCARQLTGGTYEVAVYAGPRALEPIAPLAAMALGPKETKNVTIAVTAPQLMITGSVADPHGAPVVDAIVRIVESRIGAPSLDLRLPSSVTVTDESGRFALTKLAAGDYTLIATARDGSEVITPSIAAGAKDVKITLAAAGRIEGTLVGFATPPTVTAQLHNGTYTFVDVEVEGSGFRAAGLSPGPYVVMAVTDAREADTKQIVVRPGETTKLTMTNRGTTIVTGVVRDFRTRAPVTGLRCAAMARSGHAIGSVYMGPDEAVPVDARGAFRLTSPAGEISLICMGGNRSGNRLAVAQLGRTTPIDVLTVAMTQIVPGTIDAGFDHFGRRISELVKGGEAERAGLAIGDEVIAVDGASVLELVSQETMLLITQRPAGTAAQLTILRDGKERSIVVTVRAPN